jgi:hypothetical protein
VICGTGWNILQVIFSGNPDGQPAAYKEVAGGFCGMMMAALRMEVSERNFASTPPGRKDAVNSAETQTQKRRLGTRHPHPGR